MTGIVAVQPDFVEFIPEQLDQGTLYVSMKYATATHLCCCGCGLKVVTPLSPTDWKLTFDGESVTLYPSIGNWGFECRSHYWIDKNRVVWAEMWNRTQIEAGRSKVRRAKEAHYETPSQVPGDTPRKANRIWEWLKSFVD